MAEQEEYRVVREPIILPGGNLVERSGIATPHGTVQVALLFDSAIEPAEKTAILEDLAEALNHARQLRAERLQEKEKQRSQMHLWLQQMSPEYRAMLEHEVRDQDRRGPREPAPE